LRSYRDWGISGVADNTARALHTGFRHWTAFCLEYDRSILPVDPEDLMQCLSHMVEAGYSRAALEQVVFSIHHLGPIFDCPDPTVTVVYKAWWKDLCRTQLSMDQHQANPITLSVRDALLAAIDDALSRAPSALLHRDAALIAVMYDGLLRASELSALRWDDLAQAKKGACTLTIRRSKIDQEGLGAVAYLTRETTERIERWRSCCFTRCDWLFHAAPRNWDRMNDAPPGRMSPHTIKQALDRASALARLDGTHLSGHSARVGAAQDMVACGMSMPSIMQVGRWKDPTMVARYTRNLDAVAAGEDRFARLARLTPQP
jgi:site-specific recombinase XerD